MPKAPSALLGRARGRSSSPPPVRAASQPLSLSSLMQRIAPGQHEQAEEGSSAGDGEEAASELALERRTADTVGSAIAGYIAHTLRRTTTPARVRASLDGQCQLVAAEAEFSHRSQRWLGRAVPRATALALPSATEVAVRDALGGAPSKDGAQEETTPNIRRFLRPVTNSELGAVRKFASLSAFAYLIESVTVRRPALRACRGNRARKETRHGTPP